MKTAIVIEAGTAAGTAIVSVTAKNPTTISAFGFNAGADVVDIEFSPDGGTTWEDCYKDGSQVQLTTTNNQVTIYGPGMYRANKGITTEDVGVAVSSIQGNGV